MGDGKKPRQHGDDLASALDALVETRKGAGRYGERLWQQAIKTHDGASVLSATSRSG